MRCAVVGAGLTGLATALGLARRGVDVELIEAGDHLGGVARGVQLAGHRFCPGPQYLWGFGDDGDATRLLRALDVVVPTLPMPADFERLQLGGGAWHAAAAVLDDDTLSAGDRRFLDELAALGRVGACLEHEASFRLDGAAMIAAVARHGSAADVVTALRARHLSVAALAARCGASSSTVRRVLYSQGIFAERLDELSAVLFAAAWRHLQQPLRVPVGGVVALVDGLIAATQRATAVSTGERILDVETTDTGVVLRSDRRALDVDAVVFCTSPAALPERLQTGSRATFAPSHTIGAVCLAIDTDDDDRALLHWRNFTRFVSEHDDTDVDVDFDRAGHVTATLNFTVPTLNGVEDLGAAAARQVVCAFFPLGRTDDADIVIATAEAAVVHALSGVLGHAVDVVARLPLPPSAWDAHFGASTGAVYGRRLTSTSMRRSLVGGLPANVHLAHSAVGIPGVLGCLQQAAVVVDDVMRGRR